MKASTSLLLCLVAIGGVCAAAEAPLESDIPKEFTDKFAAEQDYVRRTEMVAMRDGVKLQTIIMIPKGAHDAPIMLTRTPYNAAGRSQRAVSHSMLATLPLADQEFVEAGYIRVYQDTRGKFGSEGDYVMMRPVRGPLNPATTDHVTDAWDTIDWLVKNIPESNGKVGMIGSSYEGFTAVMALLDPHPALKAVVPESPVTDAWMGDDWFHYGAFRNLMLGYVHMQTAQKGTGDVTPRVALDSYEEFLRAGSTGDYVRAHGIDKLPYVARMLEHPAYDGFWQGQDLNRLVAAHPSSVPTLWEQGLWDQEDMWGANHAWLALKAAGHSANNWLVMGPWRHSQINGVGFELGPLRWEGDTAAQYRRDMVLPFLNEHLRGGPPAQLARVTVYNTAENHWERFQDWPGACQSGCASGLTPLYLGGGFGLSFEQPKESGKQGDSYVSDPAKPVPFLPRPVIDPFYGYYSGAAAYPAWAKWLVQDQRFVDSRPDVLTYETPVLTSAVRVRGDSHRRHSRDDDRQRRRFRREAHRCLPRRISERSADGRIPAGDCPGYLPRPLPRELRASDCDSAERAAVVSLRPAQCESRIPAGAPDHGAGPVDAVPAVRPQSPDLRAEYLQCQACRLSASDHHCPALQAELERHLAARGEVA